jgi:hypothetical protein
MSIERVPKQLLLQIEIHLKRRIQANQTRVYLCRPMQAPRIYFPSTPEILSIPRHQHEVLLDDVFHQLPVLETQPSTVSNGSGLDMPGIDRELRELWGQALIDEQSTDHAFVSWRVT